MSWILDHLNIIIVGILVIGSFLKSRFDSANQNEQETEEVPDFDDRERSERRSPSPSPYVPPPVLRTPPPVPAQSSPTPSPVFAATRSQSGAMTASADEAAALLQRQRDIDDRLRTIREARFAKGSAKPSTRPRAVTGKPIPVASASTSIRARLRNPAELRRAFVLREIVDPPVTLR
ncbi:MAG: hypothetical protein V4640_01760 [Verrucomicrobiota bacterium]